MSKLSKELEQAAIKADAFENEVKSISNEVNQPLKVQETERQTKLSQREIDKNDGVYLKPERKINSKEPFNEKYRLDFEYASHNVAFIAENKEIIGESIELWTKPFPGMSAEFWKVPVNKKVWGPRYLAEQISRKSYTRLKTEDNTVTSSDGYGTYTGHLVASHKVQRLDARPAGGFHSDRKSDF